MLSSKLASVLAIFLISLSVYSQVPNNIKNTVWKQEGYDRILSIKDSTYAYFNINQYSCELLVEGIFNGRFEVINSHGKLLVLNPGGIVNYSFKKINSLSKNCNNETMLENHSFENNFNSFWETFNENYAFFEKRNINWHAIYNKYLPVVKKLKSEKEFAQVLLEIVGNFHDGHIRLNVPDSLRSNNKKARNSTSVISKKQILSSIETKYLENNKSYNNGVIKWGVIKNSNIGYIGITDMNNLSNYVSPKYQNTAKFDSIFNQKKYSIEPLEQFNDEIKGVEEVMKSVMNDFRNIDSVIIDLRFNGGGYETVALKLLSYFVPQQKHILSIKAKTKNGFTPAQKYILKPASDACQKRVFLLMSPNTASAAEIFALGTLCYPNIKRIGTNSAGIFSEILWKKLPNGWEYSLSNEVYLDSYGRSYEETGIPVDYELNYSKEKSEFYNSFYHENIFVDKAIDLILNIESR